MLRHGVADVPGVVVVVGRGGECVARSSSEINTYASAAVETARQSRPTRLITSFLRLRAAPQRHTTSRPYAGRATKRRRGRRRHAPASAAPEAPGVVKSLQLRPPDTARSVSFLYVRNNEVFLEAPG